MRNGSAGYGTKENKIAFRKIMIVMKIVITEIMAVISQSIFLERNTKNKNMM